MTNTALVVADKRPLGFAVRIIRYNIMIGKFVVWLVCRDEKTE